MQRQQPDKQGQRYPGGNQQKYRSPFFSQSQGKKQPMISHSAVAKKAALF
jgi:hypothetical protein